MFIKIKITIYKIYYNFWCMFHKPPKVIGTDETIEMLINNSCSISRFGDGEFSLIFGKSLPFQEYSTEISNKLKKVLSSDLKNHLVAIPNVFNGLEEFSTKSKNWWRDYLLANRKKIYKILKKNKTYYDAQITRVYINRKNKESSEDRFNNLKKIWENKKILIVEGELSRFGAGNDLFFKCKEIKRILIPAKNAFDKYDDIINEIESINQSYSFDLILLVAGPTATCMAYDLHIKGLRAIDIGNLDMEYEWMKLGCTEQTPIFGKYTHEATGGDQNIKKINDDKYDKQIVSRIL